MARIQDRQRAEMLRKQGRTYSEIKEKLGVSKSTLSDWLREFPLTDDQFENLAKNKRFKKNVAIEKTRIIKQKKRDNRLKAIYDEEKIKWTSLTSRELELAGLFLYWGEGNKSLKSSVSINNTDPNVLKFAFYWLTHGLHVPKEKIKVNLHLYNDMNINEEINYWSNELQIPMIQFIRPYIKESKRVNITHKGYGHGTCALVVHNARLKERIIMGINAIASYYNHQ